MDKFKIKVGLLDDDANKLINLKVTLSNGFEDSDVDKKQRYSMYEFIPIEFDLKNRKNAVVEDILTLIKDGELDALFIDYKLSVYSNITLNGVEITKKIQENFVSFPIYIMTAYDDDLYQSELCSPSIVFDSSRYLDEESERDEMHVKIIQQVEYNEKILDHWEEQLKELLAKENPTKTDKERIIELDSKIEEHLFTKDKLQKDIKTGDSLSRLSEIANNIEKILEKIDKR